jgi:O-antigen ligase
MPANPESPTTPSPSGGRFPDADARPYRQPRRPEESGRYFKIVLWLLGALLIALPTVTLPSTGVWIGLKALALETVGIILAVYIVSAGQWTWPRVRAALLAAPNVAILAFLLWIAISVARPDVHPLFKQMSYFEALRHLGGALIYFAVVYGLSVRRHLSRLLWFLAAAAFLAAIIAFTTYGESIDKKVAGAFQNAQLLAGFLCLILPVMLTASAQDDDVPLRTGAQIAVIVMAAGILVSQNRSAWFGTAAALLVVMFLYLRYHVLEEGIAVRKHALVVPALMVILIMGLAFSMRQVTSLVLARAETLRTVDTDRNVQWRLGMWSKAIRMTRDRPIFGWGIGTFPVQQALYFHPDVPTRSQKSILEGRASLSENAHNTYGQIAAELGIPGLALYLGVLLAFLATAARAVPRVRKGMRRLVLIGTIGAIVAQMVAAVGSPAWEFPEVSLFFWLILGLGMALAGIGERGHAPPLRRPAGEKGAGYQV